MFKETEIRTKLYNMLSEVDFSNKEHCARFGAILVEYMAVFCRLTSSNSKEYTDLMSYMIATLRLTPVFALYKISDDDVRNLVLTNSPKV